MSRLAKLSSNEITRQPMLLIAACVGVICSSIVLPFYTMGLFVVPVTEEFGWSRTEFQLSLLFSTGIGVFTSPVIGILIHRFGAKAIEDGLPPLIKAVRETGSPVLWICDPMHGNTESTADGTKTRRFDNIIAELEAAHDVHQSMGSYLGGVHLELTGENVTECTGGARGLTDGDLTRAYKSTVDPRLNYEQAMEVAMRLSGLGKTQD